MNDLGTTLVDALEKLILTIYQVLGPMFFYSTLFFVLCLRNSFIILQCLKTMEGGLNSF